MIEIAFPYRIDGRGVTANVNEEPHVRELIEQVLFTNPGERVNRPDFGSGLLKLLFAPNNDILAAATQLAVQGQLQQWLSDYIHVENVDVRNADSQLIVTVTYIRKAAQQRSISQYLRAIP